MEAVEVLGALAALVLVSCGISWWRAGRRGIDPDHPDHRTLESRIGRGTAEYRAGPDREPKNP